MFLFTKMIFSIKYKFEIENKEEIENLQSKVKQVRLVENLGQQGFSYDVKELFELITKVARDKNQN